MKPQSYDLIGDIHGQYDKLEALLRHLDYTPTGDTWKHSEGRKVIFLGDYIDRGPKIRQVLQTVRGMVDAGDALAIMGNHEYNAVCYDTPDGNGSSLCERNERHTRTHQATLTQFNGLDDEWSQWLDWMKQLPMFLDLGGLRAVHACWDANGIEQLKGKSLADDEFLRTSATKVTPEHRAIETVLKGPELDLPEGSYFQDKEAVARRTIRVRWWDLPETSRVSALALPVPFDVPGDADPQKLRDVPNYGADEPPVFFGHYWLPDKAPRAPLAKNVICLDFSAGLGGTLVAYRWDGESVATANNFKASPLDQKCLFGAESRNARIDISGIQQRSILSSGP